MPPYQKKKQKKTEFYTVSLDKHISLGAALLDMIRQIHVYCRTRTLPSYCSRQNVKYVNVEITDNIVGFENVVERFYDRLTHLNCFIC